MNAAIRSVVRLAGNRGWTIVGIRRGYQGLIAGDFEDVGPRSVSNIIQRGGTMLKTARSPEFMTEDGQTRACRALDARNVDGLVAIGGDGTFRGAAALGRRWKGQIVGVPGTIDNDLFGTDYTIGYDTAINTAVVAIDKIRDTAESHERVFFLEVMGRHAGFIALEVGIGGGAEEILVPEHATNLRAVCDRLASAIARGKGTGIIVVAEGDEAGGAFDVARKVKEVTGRDFRVTVLGHLQRGGWPSARDRVLATKLGAFAVDVLEGGEPGVMVGEVRGELVTTPFDETSAKKKSLDPYLWSLIGPLAR
jgi:6-phosphofructokinase 1